MRFLLDILWLVLSGFWIFLGYMIVGLLWCITILGIPFGIASFRIGRFALWPFGRTIVKKPAAGVATARHMVEATDHPRDGVVSAVPPR